MKTILVSLAALSTVFAGAPALAQSAQSVAVRVNDLDLSTASGRHTLDRRVATATEAVCGSYFGTQDAEARRISRCRSEVSAQVAPRLAATRTQGSVATR
ncbi:MAG: UrcA family protein [Sphingomonas sp.]